VSSLDIDDLDLPEESSGRVPVDREFSELWESNDEVTRDSHHWISHRAVESRKERTL
jgi:hypothetical protein